MTSAEAALISTMRELSSSNVYCCFSLCMDMYNSYVLLMLIRRHIIRAHHGPETAAVNEDIRGSDSDTVPFTCPLCDGLFESADNLHEHIQVEHASSTCTGQSC